MTTFCVHPELPLVVPPGPIVIDVRSPAPRQVWHELVSTDRRWLVHHTPAWTDAVTASGPFTEVSRLYELSDGRRFVLPLVRRNGVEMGFPEGWGYGGLVGPQRDAAAIAVVLADLQSRGVTTHIRPDPVDADKWADATVPGVVVTSSGSSVDYMVGGR